MVRPTLMMIGLAAVVLLASRPEPAQAQFAPVGQRSVRNATRNYLYNRPTVSPYLNLTTRNTSGMSNYHTLVRPQLEQQEVNQQRQQQTVQMQRQLNQVQDRFRQSQSQVAGMMITGRIGWSSRGFPRHGSYLNFYPGFQTIARRR